MVRSTSCLTAACAVGLLILSSACARNSQRSAARGEKLFQELRCSTCHSVKGVGGASAPALGAQADQTYTPNTMAGSMWSRVTKMWDAMAKAGISQPKVTEQQAADPFAYFGGRSGPDKPGNAG